MIKFESHKNEVLNDLESKVLLALEICGEQSEKYAKRKCPVRVKNGGTLRNSIAHNVVSSEKAAYIGTNVEYAPYVEFGTGIYYNDGEGGRHTPWEYEDKLGRWHHSEGQKPQPYLKPAVAENAAKYQRIIKNELSK